MKAKWTVEYGNDVSANDDSFWEWWGVLYEGERVFRADTEEDAKNLADTLNRLEADRDCSVGSYVS